MERDVSHVANAATNVEKLLSVDAQSVIAEGPAMLQQLQEKVLFLDAKLKESCGHEREAAESCKRRLDHLRDGCQSPLGFEGNKEAWRKTRVDRMLVEHFLR